MDKIENIVTADGQKIGLAGIGNARQLGGYMTADGKRVKENLLLRTANLSRATEEDLNQLKENYHLGTIVDFRTPLEIEKDPDPEMEGVSYHAINIMDENASDAMKMSVTKMYTEDPLKAVIGIVESGMLSDNMYVEMLKPDSAMKGYREFFQILLNNPEGKAVLWHCTAGKDRTGMAAVFLLSVLGVDEKTILDDYELTNCFSREMLDKVSAAVMQKTNSAQVVEGVKAIVGVSRGYMQKMIDTLKGTYGSVAGYVTECLGISAEEIETLRDRYLESMTVL